MLKSGKTKCGRRGFQGMIVACAAAITFLPSVLVADQISLVAHDQSATIMGELQRYDDTLYYVNTSLGDIVVSSMSFGCQGETCPSDARVHFDLQKWNDVSEVAADQ